MFLLSHDIVFTGVLAIHLCELLLLYVLPLQNGDTAMILASTEGHEVVVKALLKAGATVDMQEEVLLYWTFSNSSHKHPMHILL